MFGVDRLTTVPRHSCDSNKRIVFYSVSCPCVMVFNTFEKSAVDQNDIKIKYMIFSRKQCLCPYELTYNYVM